MVLLLVLLLGSITTQLPAMNKKRTFPRSAESALAQQRLLEATREAASIFSQPESISTEADAATAALLQEELQKLETAQAAATDLPKAAVGMQPENPTPMDNTEEGGEREPGEAEVSEEPGAADSEGEMEPEEDIFLAPLFGEEDTTEAISEKQPKTADPETTPAKAKKQNTPRKVKKAQKPKKPAKKTKAQQAAPELPVAIPVTPAAQQFITQFTIAARTSSFGTALATALHAEPGASAQAVDAALQLFFNAWATTLYTTSQTLVTNVQTELSGCTGSWVGGFCYSCYNPAWRIGIEQLARNQLTHDILTQLQTAADRAQQAAETQSPGQAAAIKTMIAALHKHLSAHDAATQAPRAHQFVALAEQQQRSRASNIGRYIILHRKQAAVLTVGVLLAMGYFWHRRRQNRQDYY